MNKKQQSKLLKHEHHEQHLYVKTQPGKKMLMQNEDVKSQSGIKTQITEKDNRGNIWHWYKTRSREMKISFGCTSLIAIILLYSLVIAVFNHRNISIQTSPTPSISPTTPINEQPIVDPTSFASPSRAPIAFPTPMPSLYGGPKSQDSFWSKIR